ncbi:acyltransferase family protein [Georgenia sp. Z1491]|uniref:acyltransferase family protein n=1 Tax=Georgenia sp. Z1491 TaxID=3416707 RepID=UPI003CECA869
MPDRPPSPTTPRTGAPTQERLHWVDAAKAAAIILVVAYHLGGAGMDRLLPNPDGFGSVFWTRANDVLLPMRMPLFFLTAGLLAHRAVRRPWPVVARSRVLVLLWPYVLWSLAFASFAGFAYQPAAPEAYALDRLKAIPFAGTAYWFLAVLVVFFVTAKLLRRWPAVVLGLTLVLAATAPYLEPVIEESVPSLATYAVVRVARYAFWYFLGCYAFSAVKRLSELPPWPVLLIGGSAFTGLTAVALLAGLDRPLAFPLSVAGLAAAVGGSVLAVRSGRVRTVSRYIAGRTLPIYLVHPVLINLVVLAALLLGGPLPPNDALATWLTPVLVAVSVAVSVVVYDAAMRTPLRVLFQPPERLTAVRA